MRSILLFACAVCTCISWDSPCHADVQAQPWAFVRASRKGTCFFKMVPGKWPFEGDEYLKTPEDFGIAYRVEEDGTVTELWRVSGWYSSSVFISDNGRYLVRMAQWAAGAEPEEADLAVAFYDQGRLLKQYSTTDLVQDKTAVVRTMSHYFWKAGAPVLDPQNVFHLQTIDGIIYEFDATTGRIKTQRKTPIKPPGG